MSFAATLLKIYDRKILSGEISFSQSGISKDDFTRICTDSTFVLPKESLMTVCEKMNLSDEERASLMAFLPDEI